MSDSKLKVIQINDNEIDVSYYIERNCSQCNTCGKPFCLKDRLPEKHSCSHVPEIFQIEKIVKEKIIKI